MAPTMLSHLIPSKWPQVRVADVLRLGALLIDPRGRCNRKAMTVLTVVFIVLQALSMLVANAIGGDLGVGLFWTVNTPIMLIGSIAVVKRLHDVGLSGLWAPAACALWITAAFAATLVMTLVVGPDRMALVVEEKGPLYWLVFSFVFVPAFGGFIWLHSAPGTSGANRFGPLPGNDGVGPGHGGSRSSDLPSNAVAAG